MFFNSHNQDCVCKFLRGVDQGQKRLSYQFVWASNEGFIFYTPTVMAKQHCFFVSRPCGYSCVYPQNKWTIKADQKNKPHTLSYVRGSSPQTMTLRSFCFFCCLHVYGEKTANMIELLYYTPSCQYSSKYCVQLSLWQRAKLM